MTSLSIRAAARAAAAMLVLVLATPATARSPAETTDGTRTSLHVILGGYVPAGEQRRLLEPTVLSGGQLGVRVRPRLALVAAVAVAQSADRRLTADGFR